MASVTGPRPPVKEEELKANDKEKCSWGPDCPFLQMPRRKRKTASNSSRRHCQKYKNHQAKRPDTLNLNMTKAKQQWEAEMERLNSKYNLDCFSDSELESYEGEQYHYEHGYETLI